MSQSFPSIEPLAITVVSDVVCPWCFIGKKRIEKAVAMVPQIPVAVKFHPYYLNAWVPRAGISRHEYLTTKFGSAEKYLANAPRVAAAAAEEGLVYNYEKIARQPNTIDSHRLIRWAGENGPAMKQRLMDLYFTEGGDLTDREVLVAAAADCGLDPDSTRARLATDEDEAVIEAEAKSASEAGIQGVPCFIFAGTFAVSGAQASDYLANAIERAAREAQKPAA